MPRRLSIFPTLCLGAVCSLLLAAGCQQMPEAARQRSYRDSQQRFALDLPSGWATRKEGATTVFVVPLPGAQGSASVTVTVSVEAGGEAAGDAAAEAMLERLRRQLSVQSLYQEQRTAVVPHPNGLRAAYIEATVASATIGGRPRQMRLYGFPLAERQVLIKALMPVGIDDARIISGANTILDSFIVW